MEFNGVVENNHTLSQDEEDDDDLEEISKELKERPSAPATLNDHYNQNNNLSHGPSNSSMVPPGSS